MGRKQHRLGEGTGRADAQIEVSMPMIPREGRVLDSLSVSSWDQIEFGDLLAAFRKADSFFERSAYVAEDFAHYEERLVEHLQALLRRLRSGEVDQVLEEAQQSRAPSVFAKGVKFEPRPAVHAAADVHAFFSDASTGLQKPSVEIAQATSGTCAGSGGHTLRAGGFWSASGRSTRLAC